MKGFEPSRADAELFQQLSECLGCADAVSSKKETNALVSSMGIPGHLANSAWANRREVLADLFSA